MMGNMQKLRNKTQNSFTVVTNSILKNRELGLKERGLLITLLSLPDGWNFSVAGLASIIPDGRDSIKAGLRRLEQLGYLVRKQTHGNDGKFQGAVWEIFEDTQTIEPPLTENPLTVNMNPSTIDGRNPIAEKPLTENPPTGKPLAENLPQLNTKEYNIQRINNQGERRALTPFGIFNNVFLTLKEKEKVIKDFEDGQGLINKVSGIFENTDKVYKNHYAFILKIAGEDGFKRSVKVFPTKEEKELQRRLEDQLMEQNWYEEKMETLGFSTREEVDDYINRRSLDKK